MDPTGFWALGTQIQIGDGGDPGAEPAVPEAFTTIEGLDSISGPEQLRDTIETTSHSAVGGFATYIGGKRDSGEITADMFWTAHESQVAVEDAYNANETVNFRVVIPDDEETTYQFAGFVTNLSWTFDIDDAVKRSMTIKISGPVTEIEGNGNGGGG